MNKQGEQMINQNSDVTNLWPLISVGIGTSNVRRAEVCSLVVAISIVDKHHTSINPPINQSYPINYEEK